MPTCPKRSRDPVQAAHQVYLEIIGEAPRQELPENDPATVAKRKGAATGGEKRASKLTPERRREGRAYAVEQKASRAGHFR
jgi:hypothetical protein